jgi:hypothetical protein
VNEPRTKRIVWVAYAINGRGVGHLVRQLAIVRQARWLCALLGVQLEPWVFTSSEADTLARREGVCALKIPSKAMMRDAGLEPSRYLAITRAWALQTIAGLQPDLLVVDTFPGGSYGELVAALELAPRRVLVARAVRGDIADDEAYRALLPLYHYQVVPDTGGVGPVLSRERDEVLSRDEARAALGIVGDQRAVYVSLGGGGEVSAAGVLPTLVDRLRARGWHVVVGAGPLYQGPERRGPGITWLERYQVVELFAGLDAAVSAAGYNSWAELMHHGVPTVFWPQPRLADDQEARARRAAEAGAGRMAQTLEEIPDLLEHPGDPGQARALVPGGGARAAAVACLCQLLPAEDVHAAAAWLTPAARHLLAGMGDYNAETARRTLALYRFLAGGTPGSRRQDRVQAAALAERGLVSPISRDESSDPAMLLRLTTLASGPGLATTLHLLDALRRKFPAATAADLLGSAETLFGAWAPFADWMGAVALVRAVPVQRGTYPVRAFAADMERWLTHEDDLFTALGHFSRLEARGARTAAEVLRALARQEPA